MNITVLHNTLLLISAVYFVDNLSGDVSNNYPSVMLLLTYTGSREVLLRKIMVYSPGKKEKRICNHWNKLLDKKRCHR